MTGPSSFGTGSGSAKSGTGDFGGVELYSGTGNGALAVSPEYVSGTQFTGSDTYDNKTIAGLGLTVGIYTYTYGPSSDTFTINIGNVPEPSTAVLAAFGAVGSMAYVWSRHRRQAGLNPRG
jgi:hypothetical protein